MIEDPRFCVNTQRVKHRELVDEAVGGWFATKTRDEALAAMRDPAPRSARSTPSIRS